MQSRSTTDTPARKKARFRNLVVAVFALVIALNVFILTEVPMDEVGDIGSALQTYVPLFLLVVIIWQVTAEVLDRFPDDDALLYPAVIVVLFLTTLAPVLLNLLLDPLRDVQEAGALLFTLDMAAIFAVLTVLWLAFGPTSRPRECRTRACSRACSSPRPSCCTSWPCQP